MKKKTKTTTKKQPKPVAPVQAMIITESCKRIQRKTCLKQLEAHKIALNVISREISRLHELSDQTRRSMNHWRDIVNQQHYQEVEQSTDGSIGSCCEPCSPPRGY